MLKIKKTISLLVLTFTLYFNAQTNKFQNTTWEIKTISADGKAVLKKAKKLNLPSEQSKFHFLQLGTDKFNTGNSCFQMDGRYNFYEPNIIEFSEGAADMAGDCKEPKSLTGNYTYIFKNDTVELTPAAKIDYDEPMPEVAEIAEQPVAEAVKPGKKSTKKSAKK